MGMLTSLCSRGRQVIQQEPARVRLTKGKLDGQSCVEKYSRAWSNLFSEFLLNWLCWRAPSSSWIYPYRLLTCRLWSFRTGCLRQRVAGPVLRGHHALIFSLILAAASFSPGASAQNSVFKLPPVKIPLDIKDQPVTITVWATVTIAPRGRDAKIVNLELTGDLSELQRNLTGLLSSQLNKDDRCGDRITIQNATLMPADPAAVASIQLHVERWACVKLLGKQAAKKLLGGDAQIQIKLTPAINQDGTGLQLVPEVNQIQADGSLGEVLRSGALGDTIREKIRNAILSALQKGTNVSATLPPAVQSYVTIQNAAFKNSGESGLLVVLGGSASITQEQLRTLSDQVKERMASR